MRSSPPSSSRVATGRSSGYGWRSPASRPGQCPSLRLAVNRTPKAPEAHRNLPDDERAAVAELAAAAPGSMWLGAPAGPDEHAAAQPGYTRQMISVLSERDMSPIPPMFSRGGN